MKFHTSYFYQLRFFSPNMIPISTAQWDPAWFHEFKDRNHVFVDKRGVYNGLRADPLVLPQEYWENLVKENVQCTKECPHESTDCAFMKAYRSYLDTLDFKAIIGRCENLAKRAQNKAGFAEDPIIILLVHEASSCPCAERPVLQQWFHDNGYELTEWKKEEKI